MSSEQQDEFDAALGIHSPADQAAALGAFNDVEFRRAGGER